MRAFVAAAFVLLLLVTAPVARADAPGLLDAIDAEQVALAGPDVIVAREVADGGLAVEAVPRAGGAARTVAAIPGARLASNAALSASAQRVVLLVERHGRRGRTIGWEIHGGPPSGPLEVLWRSRARGRRAWLPLLADVDGDRVLVVKLQRDGRGVRAVLLGPAGERRRLSWAGRRFLPVAIAGDRAAVVAARPRRVAMADLGSGRVIARRRVGPTDESWLDVAADGRLVTGTRKGLLTWARGVGWRHLPGTVGWEDAAFAGDGLAAIRVNDTSAPVFLGKGVAARVLGGPTGFVKDHDADADGVAWLANGCVRYAPLSGAPGAMADACPATEIGLYGITSSRLRGGAVRVPVNCIATPTDACRGTLVLSRFDTGQVVATAPFAVSAGTEQKVRVPVDATALAVAREDGGWAVNAEIPGGRVGPGGQGAAELSLKE
jgi:hypothetical protein